MKNGNLNDFEAQGTTQPSEATPLQKIEQSQANAATQCKSKKSKQPEKRVTFTGNCEFLRLFI